MYRTNSCKWGDMCRHKHVLCRFDTKCTKRDTCPFGHSNAGPSTTSKLDAKSTGWMPKKHTTNMTTTTTTTTNNNAKGRMYAIDCEFIEIASPSPTTGAADLSTTRKCVVSVGIVDVELEIVLYARVRKPPRMIVVDDSFARTVGGLGSDWSKGIHVEAVRTLLTRFLTAGGVLVGWSLEHDLAALGLKCSASQIVELTNVYQTESAKKCRLSEAYRSVFNRTANAHHASDDAKMTMELYLNWKRNGFKKHINVSLCWYVVRWSKFISNETRCQILWSVLRPERSDREIVSLRESSQDGSVSLQFRTESDRSAYLNVILKRVRERRDVTCESIRDTENGREMVFNVVTGSVYNITR
eukprot:g2200.t1